ncbi:MAG: plasmid stabilization protein [Deltaproteobacteria bacterium]|nr:MAG: plasmid stabilization protein [Deltaproteobacteria bacterium]
MAEIRWTEEAADWLEDIYSYIAADSRQSAQRVIEGIYQKAQLLEDHPQAGYFYKTAGDGEVRILPYGHYRIAYLLPRTRRYVDILGVFHGSLDIERFFR